MNPETTIQIKTKKKIQATNESEYEASSNRKHAFSRETTEEPQATQIRSTTCCRNRTIKKTKISLFKYPSLSIQRVSSTTCISPLQRAPKEEIFIHSSSITNTEEPKFGAKTKLNRIPIQTQISHKLPRRKFDQNPPPPPQTKKTQINQQNQQE